jgi:excisionase family DNA binding protein
MARILNTDQAAELLGVSKRTVWDWLRAGRIPGRRVGKYWLMSEEALIAFIEGDARGPVTTSASDARRGDGGENADDWTQNCDKTKGVHRG